MTSRSGIIRRITKKATKPDDEMEQAWKVHLPTASPTHKSYNASRIRVNHRSAPITKDAPFSHGACQGKIGQRLINSNRKRLHVLGCERQQTFQRKPSCARNHSSTTTNIRSRMAAHLARKPPAFTYGTSRSMSRFNAPTCEASASKFTATRKRLLKNESDQKKRTLDSSIGFALMATAPLMIVTTPIL